MRRLLNIAVLLAAAPACAFAQSSPETSATAVPPSPIDAPAKAKSRNPFGQAIAELTRQARQQATAPPDAKPAAHAPAHPREPVAADGPALAGSNGR